MSRVPTDTRAHRMTIEGLDSETQAAMPAIAPGNSTRNAPAASDVVLADPMVIATPGNGCPVTVSTTCPVSASGAGTAGATGVVDNGGTGVDGADGDEPPHAAATATAAIQSLRMGQECMPNDAAAAPIVGRARTD